jgi:hypothetical protein
MYLLRYLCCLIFLLLGSYGCSSSSQDFSVRTNLFLTCMNEMWDYERDCLCEIYPKGYKKDDYCHAWSTLKMQGYNVPLDI